MTYQLWNISETNKGEIAAMILEPVVGNSGFIAPKPEFLDAICKITKEIGALLIFEKVIIRNTWHVWVFFHRRACLQLWGCREKWYCLVCLILQGNARGGSVSCSSKV